MIRKKLIVIATVFIISGGLTFWIVPTKPSNAWNVENPYSGHYFMINKAVDYLRANGLLSDWRLEDYVAYLNYGAYWADYPYNPIGATCNWSVFKSLTCDSLHHFATGGCIDVTDIPGGACIGKGYFGAPEYAETLYGLAVKFWPYGEPVPSIYDLPHKNSGGWFTTKFDEETFGPFVIGAHPFAYEITGDEYRWPGFVDEDIYSTTQDVKEDWQTSLIYLGWAIHLIQDMCCPVHATMQTGTYHASYEEYADELIHDEKLDHLPINPGDEYVYVKELNEDLEGIIDTLHSMGLFENLDIDDFDIPARPDFFHADWSIEDFAQESIRLAKEKDMNFFFEFALDLLGKKALNIEIERQSDTGIKMTAGIIYKFFSNFELPKDSFEPDNDLPAGASVLESGRYDDLTIHTPLDSDFYEITTTDDFSRVLIIINYDRREGELAKNIEYWEYCGDQMCHALEGFRITDYGAIYEESFVPSGRMYSFSVASLEGFPAHYSMIIYVGRGDLPQDKYEENNNVMSATEWHTIACDYTGDLCIHDPFDVDYYKKNAEGYSIKAEISFNPNMGELELYLDNNQATEFTISNDGNKKTLSIIGCGKSPNYVRVQGVPNFYNLCFEKVPLSDNCQGDHITWVPLLGSGSFIFTGQDCVPNEPPPESTYFVREIMYAKVTSESPSSVLWSIAVWLDHPSGAFFPLIIEIHCPKSLGSNSTGVNAKILDQQLDDIVWFGSAQGECFSLETPGFLTSFSAVINMTSIKYPWCIAPGHGVLAIQGDSDSDSDGIPNQDEINTGTNPNSDDTDGDGLPDCAEDENLNGQVDPGETDPRSCDTDKDGVSDGIEKGLTSPGGHDTNQENFQGDEDPSTTTDPLNKDTDSDGISDGEEDSNKNGKVDPGETSPLVKDNQIVFPATFVNITPLHTDIEGEKNFSIDVHITPTEPIAGIQLALSFNPCFLKANSVTKGDLFNGLDNSFNSGVIDNTNGTIKDVCGAITTLWGSTPSPGTLASINFTVKTWCEDIVSLNLSNVIIIDSMAIPVSISIHNGTVTIECNMCERVDFNLDGKVNILDLVLVCNHWGETGPCPGWIPEDLNCDGIVNIFDMIVIGNCWTG